MLRRCRSIDDGANVFRGIFTNAYFIAVLFFTVVAQFLIVTFGGDFTKTQPLSLEEWGLSVGIGVISLPVGVLMRFIPISESATPGGDDKNLVKIPRGSGVLHLSEWLFSAILALPAGLLVALGILVVYHKWDAGMFG